MNNTRLELGKWNVICDRCFRKLKNTDVRKEWTGFMVCERCWEARHPQDLIKAIKESGPRPFVRPEKTTDDFQTVPYISESTGTQETTIPAGTFNMSLS